MSLRKDSEASARTSDATRQQPAAPRDGGEMPDVPSETGPMTDVQAAELKALSRDAFEPEAFDSTLTQAQAARRIDALRAKLSLQDSPPHTL